MATRRYAAFLRGINVGRRRVGGEQLRACFEAVAGIAWAESFLASGNVVFDYSGRRKDPSLSAAIEAELGEGLGFQSSVFLRDRERFLDLSRTEPFSTAELEASAGRPQITLYATAPADEARRQILALATKEDRLVFADRELHWLPSGGISDSRLDLTAIDRLHGPGTTRTRSTINRMAKKYFGE